MKRIGFGMAAVLVAGGMVLGQLGSAAAHTAVCIESVNPHGQNIPPAGSTTLPGPRGGQNDDGFYLIGSLTGGSVWVINADHSAQFGPFPSGTNVKITEAPGATPSIKKMGGPNSAVDYHITLDTDAYVVNERNEVTACLVPPPPK
jgi:hypothetical protein